MYKNNDTSTLTIVILNASMTLSSSQYHEANYLFQMYIDLVLLYRKFSLFCYRPNDEMTSWKCPW